MTETLDFVVIGSQGDPYEITATRDGADIRISCDCPAGDRDQLCRHRLALLNGDVTDLDSDNDADVATLGAWLPGTRLAEAIEALRKAQAAYDAAKPELARRKTALGRIMSG